MLWSELRRAARHAALTLTNGLDVAAQERSPEAFDAARADLDELIERAAPDWSETEVLRLVLNEIVTLQSTTLAVMAQLIGATVENLRPGLTAAYITQTEQLEAEGLL